jgi:hypothetical protein
MKRTPYSRKSRQLDRLIKELKRGLSKENDSPRLIERLKQKITLLLKQLVFVLSKRQVMSKLGSLAIFFGFALTNSANAQLFTGPKEGFLYWLC